MILNGSLDSQPSSIVSNRLLLYKVIGEAEESLRIIIMTRDG